MEQPQQLLVAEQLQQIAQLLHQVAQQQSQILEQLQEEEDRVRKVEEPEILFPPLADCDHPLECIISQLTEFEQEEDFLQKIETIGELN